MYMLYLSVEIRYIKRHLTSTVLTSLDLIFSRLKAFGERRANIFKEVIEARLNKFITKAR